MKVFGDDLPTLRRLGESVRAAMQEVPGVAEALQGARDILAERIAESAEIRGWVRERTREEGRVRSAAAVGKELEVSKFQDYYEYAEKLRDIPSHRMLAIRRGEAEGFLTWSVAAPVGAIHAHLDRAVAQPRRARAQMTLVGQDAYKRLLAPSIEVELRLELKTRADEEAIQIFGRGVFRAVNDPQVFAASALHGWLDDPALSLGDEVRWFYNHPLAAATGEFAPPLDRFGFALRVRDIRPACMSSP